MQTIPQKSQLQILLGGGLTWCRSLALHTFGRTKLGRYVPETLFAVSLVFAQVSHASPHWLIGSWDSDQAKTMELASYQALRESNPDLYESAKGFFGKMEWIVSEVRVVFRHPERNIPTQRYTYHDQGEKRREISFEDGTIFIVQRTGSGFCIFGDEIDEKNRYGECFKRLGT